MCSQCFCLLRSPKFFKLISKYKVIICALRNYSFRFQRKNLNLDRDSNLGPPDDYVQIWCYPELCSKFIRRFLVNRTSCSSL